MDAFLFDEAENFLGIEAVDHYVCASEQGEEMSDAPAIGMKERNGVQLDGAIFCIEVPDRRSAREDRYCGV